MVCTAHPPCYILCMYPSTTPHPGIHLLEDVLTHTSIHTIPLPLYHTIACCVLSLLVYTPYPPYPLHRRVVLLRVVLQIPLHVSILCIYPSAHVHLDPASCLPTDTIPHTSCLHPVLSSTIPCPCSLMAYTIQHTMLWGVGD